MNRPADNYGDPEYRGVGVLYHYTSIAALTSIAKTKTLWASSVHYLNDATESTFGLELLRQYVTEQRQGVNGADAEFLDFLLPWLDDWYAWLNHIFVLCFSESRDQLSQWRGYTPHGGGVCIGIHSGELVRRMQAIDWDFQLCRYTHQSQMAYVQAIVQRMRREASAIPAGVPLRDHFGAVLGRCQPEVLRIAAMIKNAAFQEEREVRFLSAPLLASAPAVNFRTGRTTLIPYLEFPLVRENGPPLQLEEVIVGPTPSGFLSVMAVENLLKRHGINVAGQVSASAVPYREL